MTVGQKSIILSGEMAVTLRIAAISEREQRPVVVDEQMWEQALPTYHGVHVAVAQVAGPEPRGALEHIRSEPDQQQERGQVSEHQQRPRRLSAPFDRRCQGETGEPDVIRPGEAVQQAITAEFQPGAGE